MNLLKIEENLSYDKLKNIRLGADYNKDYTVFSVYAPTRETVDLVIIDDYKKTRRQIFPMEKNDIGIFSVKIDGDLDGYFYNYIVENEFEVTDPYAYSASINSIYSAVIDMDETNPPGFKESISPDIKENQAIIYEMSVKNYTADKSSGVLNRGKFLGLTERGTEYKNINTGIDNIVDLGVSHVQLLPIYDFISVDESSDKFFDDDNYNWGYDPELYFAPEGSFSTNPEDPKSRVRELKEMVKSFHDRGICVIMDVVYNHTFKTVDSNLNTLVPKYYHRTNPDMSFSNGSGCGNEIASEKPFARKLIIDSLIHWAKEYKIDGFRFDLMALVDLDTIKIAIKELKKINPNIIIYGEPWMGGGSTLAYDKQILKGAQRSNGFGVFNDDFRDAIKGDVNSYGRGYIQGVFDLKNKIETGITGSINYDDKRIGFAEDASETINYFNCHDNLILFDKLAVSLENMDDINSYVKLAIGLVMLSFGKPLIYEGNEFNHSKNNDSNSYRSPLSVNAIDWSDKENNLEIFNYTKEIISLRKSIKAFSETRPDQIRIILQFMENLDKSVVGYKVKDEYLFLVNVNKNDVNIGSQNLIEFLGKNNTKIEQIFSKEGKCNIEIDLSNGINLKSLSINVYKIGENHGL